MLTTTFGNLTMGSSSNYLKAKSKSWGFTPHPTKEDCSSYPPWMLQDAPNGVESPLGI